MRCGGSGTVLIPALRPRRYPPLVPCRQAYRLIYVGEIALASTTCSRQRWSDCALSLAAPGLVGRGNTARGHVGRGVNNTSSVWGGYMAAVLALIKCLSLEVAERKGGGESEFCSRRSIRYSLSVLVMSRQSSDFVLYKRTERVPLCEQT